MTFLDEVLDAVNVIRAEHDKPTLAELPRATGEGILGSYAECPMVHALGAAVVSCSGYVLDGKRYNTPPLLAEFVARYDRGEFPELQPVSS